LNGEDLASVSTADRSTAYKILKGTHNLTIVHLRRLTVRFQVTAAFFIAFTVNQPVSRGLAEVPKMTG